MSETSSLILQVTLLQYSSSDVLRLPTSSPQGTVNQPEATLQPLWTVQGPIPGAALEANRKLGILAGAGNDLHSPVSYCIQGHRQVILNRV